MAVFNPMLGPTSSVVGQYSTLGHLGFFGTDGRDLENHLSGEWYLVWSRYPWLSHL